MTALDEQIGGSHYKDFEIQPVEFIHRNGIDFLSGNIIKYVCRWKAKGGLQDLEKAKHYVELLIELSTNKTEETLKSVCLCLCYACYHIGDGALASGCPCDCHEENKDSKLIIDDYPSCCKMYHSFIIGMPFDGSDENIKELEKMYHKQCVCDCHKEAKDG